MTEEEKRRAAQDAAESEEFDWSKFSWEDDFSPNHTNAYPWEENGQIPETPIPPRPPKSDRSEGEKSHSKSHADKGHKGKKKKHHSFGFTLTAAALYVFAVLGISATAATVGWNWANDVLALNKEKTVATVTISSGQSISEVADVMKDEGLIQYKFLFKLFAGLTHKADKITAGTYELNTNMDYSALLRSVGPTSSARQTVTITIPEGRTVTETFEILDAAGVCSYNSLVKAAGEDKFDYDFLADLNQDGTEWLEGYLFPDTYEFYLDTSADAVITRMLHNFDSRFDLEMKAELQLSDYSMQEILTIASIIEKETDGYDHKDISSVIYNRLEGSETNGLLQMDSTIQYLLPERKGHLTEEDLEIDSPYNTYKNAGLPKGAICNPGLRAIKAALAPNVTDYNYFILGNDGETHFFHAYNDFVNYRNQVLSEQEAADSEETE